MLLNPTQFPSQGLNPQFPTPPMANFNNQSSNLGSFSGNPMGMRNWSLSMPCPSLSNGTGVPPLAQNNQMGVLPLPGPFGVNQAVGTLNQVMALHLLRQQNLNFLASLQPGSTFLANNLPQNINQIVGLPNEQVHLQNLMMQRNQINALSIPPSSRPTGSNNPGFVGNLHMAVNNSNTIVKVKLSVDAKKDSVHQIGKPITRSPMQNHQNGKDMQQSGHQQPQVNSAEDGETNVLAENSARKNFTRNLRGYGEIESSYMRFQKSQFHHLKSANGSQRPFNNPGGRGQDTWRERKPHLAIYNTPARAGSQRHLPVNYTENEIRQWREARRKNFPTRANIEKQSTGSGKSNEDAAGDAKLCRQQPKEVLAKQAELGVEVAEIPPSYLSEPENLPENENERKTQHVTERFSNKYNNKRGRHGQVKRNAKKPNLKSEAFTDSSPTVTKREPTLLQKLLSAEIKRDKRQLLQVLRFMTLNSFFDGWHDNPLEFPEITVKGAGLESEIGLQKSPSLNRVDVADSGANKNLLIEEIKCKKDLSVVNKAESESSEGDEAESKSSEDDGDSASDEDEVGYNHMHKENFIELGKQDEKRSVIKARSCSHSIPSLE